MGGVRSATVHSKVPGLGGVQTEDPSPRPPQAVGETLLWGEPPHTAGLSRGRPPGTKSRTAHGRPSNAHQPRCASDDAPLLPAPRVSPGRLTVPVVRHLLVHLAAALAPGLPRGSSEEGPRSPSSPY